MARLEKLPSDISIMSQTLYQKDYVFPSSLRPGVNRKGKLRDGGRLRNLLGAQARIAR